DVVIRTASASEGWIEFRVTDSGCGLDDEAKDKVFRAFFSTKGTKGTGLGLMITRKIVREHGGEIEVDSERGKGAIFTLRLPARGAKSSSIQAEASLPSND
ncbi:MAG: ATP-binding protein, partial [Syntrophobacteraceae bacterium]